MRAVLFLTAAIVAGLGAVFLVKVYLDQARRRSAAASVETTSVVVAAKDIPSGQRLEATDLELIRWPAGHTPTGTYTKVDEVIGQTSRDNMVAGEPVLQERLANKDQGQGLAAILDSGARAMAVKVDQVVGIAGFVRPGDRVDVITTIATDEETRSALANKAQKMSKIILQDIRVLAVGEHLSTDGHKPVKVQVVTLEVQPEQSERLALASQYGTIQLTMRARVDRETVETEGVTPLALLSPEGDVTPVAAPATPSTVVAKDEPRTQQNRRPVRRVAQPVAEKQAAPPSPQTPSVIEILRGTSKVEERKIKPAPAPGGAP
ncbi:MAG TPA: Flp pilus assembly protein CpaB [Kofleriaceae bacterium]|nr:Flp pilus assembly protein CpaB [Kofleriaceae bacterium]